MINGFKYTNSDYIAKNSYYHGSELVEGVEHTYINEMKDKYKTVFWSEVFQTNELLNMNQKQIRENGYCIDHFELNTAFKKDQLESDDRTYELSVIVPVFNNGKYLLNKCFNSLKRSSIFEKMEIIIIDDGSSKKRRSLQLIELLGNILTSAPISIMKGEVGVLQELEIRERNLLLPNM